MPALGHWVRRPHVGGLCAQERARLHGEGWRLAPSPGRLLKVTLCATVLLAQIVVKISVYLTKFVSENR